MYVLTDGDRVARWPYSPARLRRDYPHVSFPRANPDASLAERGVYPVTVDPEPPHDPDTQRLIRDPQPVQIGGEWRVTWQVVDKTAAEIQADLIDAADARVREIDSLYLATLDAGFAYDFGGRTAKLPNGLTERAGVRTLQTRQDDREKWLATASLMQLLPQDAPVRDFRCVDDAQIPMRAGEALQCLIAMQAHFGRALDARWRHKDAVRALSTIGEVRAYDITTGWPET